MIVVRCIALLLALPACLLAPVSLEDADCNDEHVCVVAGDVCINGSCVVKCDLGAFGDCPIDRTCDLDPLSGEAGCVLDGGAGGGITPAEQ